MRLSDIPSIDRLLGSAWAERLRAQTSRAFLVEALRGACDGLRRDLRNGLTLEGSIEMEIERRVAARLESRRLPVPRTVVNATGVLLHTNLGRALLPEEAVAAIVSAATRPIALEFDLETGSRGDRDRLVEEDLRELTGAEAATVVNNNAAAVLLALNSLAEGREVIVSRGELVEIGGSFRIPDVMAKSGARLREVGTTNRTHASDYERAIGPDTAALLKVHTSNYRIHGFTAAVDLDRLVAIGRAHGLPVIEDLGSGALIDVSRFGLPKEPVVAERIAAGADLVTFSGDKLLGGPQAGILVGARQSIERVKANPLRRALRPGKLVLAALAAVLRLYRESPAIEASLPILRWLARPEDELDRFGAAAVARLAAELGSGYRVELDTSTAEVGSGALPTAEIPSRVVAIQHAAQSPERIARRFRESEPPIIGRIHGGRFLLDLRGIFEIDDVLPRRPRRDTAAGER